MFFKSTIKKEWWAWYEVQSKQNLFFTQL
jgi:hypothetical protein